jgi:zeta-carotene desaturase
LAEATVEQLLIALGQSDNSRSCFWYPVALATLNESPDRAAGVLFAEVLSRAFFASRLDSQFVLPKVGLSDLYTNDARRFIELHGGRVELKTPVETFRLSDGRVSGLQLRSGDSIPVDACISAVPPRALTSLLPSELRTLSTIERLGAFEPSPIVSVHLWFDRPLLGHDFVGLLGTTTHWLFNRTKITAEPGANGNQCLSAVISAGRQVIDWSPARITDTVVSDIRALFPEARGGRMLRSVVLKEKQATISPAPASERLRPGPETGIDNWFLAGDWTDTGLPPTIESAVTSGERAAALVIERLRPQ